MKLYKGFDKNMKCSDFQYEEGEIYTHPGTPKLCDEGFHACEVPLDCIKYYVPADGSIYRLDCGDARSCWKRWQEKAFSLAKKHDGQLFTYGTICDLVDRMNESVKVFKNAKHINNPDWMFCLKYGTRPAVGIGEGCTIVFQPVRGYYQPEDGHE